MTAGKKTMTGYDLSKTCGMCKQCKPVYKHNTLTVKDRRPTLGRCPYRTYCVLLSQPACKESFVPRDDYTPMGPEAEMASND